jgi:hypothetical protein
VNEVDEAFTGDLIDVSGLTLQDVESLGESTIGLALRRVLETEQSEPSLGFSARL